MSQKLGVLVNITFSKIIQLCLSSSCTHFVAYSNLVLYIYVDWNLFELGFDLAW
jgi:hypothetical protein